MGVPIISLPDLYSCLHDSPVISHLDHYSCLNATPYHLSSVPLFARGCEFLSPGSLLPSRGEFLSYFTGPLLPPGWESLSSLTWTLALAWMEVPVNILQHHCFHLEESPCDLSPGPPLLPPRLDSLSSLTLSTAPASMRVPVISHLDHFSYLYSNPCHLSPGPLLPAGCESLSSLTWTSS